MRNGRSLVYWFAYSHGMRKDGGLTLNGGRIDLLGNINNFFIKTSRYIL